VGAGAGVRMRVWVRAQVGKAVPPAEMHAGEMAAYSYGLTYCLAHCSLADCVPYIYCIYLLYPLRIACRL
jgi:hypothetical protein